MKIKLLFLIVLLSLTAGCSGPDHISVADFKTEYAMVGAPQTMRDVSFLGVRDGKAFLKIRSMPIVGSKWKERIVYVELSELDAATRDFISKQPNQALQHNDPSCHVSCLRTPRASRGRG
jgi:hypothetical protein